MTVKFDHLCTICGHLAHIDYGAENVGTPESPDVKSSVTLWCDNCGATGFKRVRILNILGLALAWMGAR